MLGLYVELPRSGNFLLVADAIYTADNAGPPNRLPGLVYDSLGYVATVKYAVEFAEGTARRSSTATLPRMMEQLRQAPDAYYD
jgi:hypothetical protein